ncbi:MAG: ABC transporter permease [Blautia sp.]
MGNISEYVKMAVQNILANKGRSFLTMLGIIIGIASVIAIMSIGEGTKNQMNSEIDDVGSGQIYIYCSNGAMTEEEYITPDDLEALREIEGVEGVSVSSSFTGETVTGKGEFTLTMSMETPDAIMINNSVMKRGAYFTQGDLEEGRNVCVISDTDAKRLFGSDDVVGMDIDVQAYDLTKTYRIVGVTTQKENGTFVTYTYEGMPASLSIPYTAAVDFLGDSTEKFTNVMIQADKSLDSQDISNKAVKVLEQRHQSAGEDYFQIQSFQDVVKMMNDMLGMITAFISFVAGISLLVGGIGVMNIMLVSVTERTREIGIRKALGAKTSSIMLQFLAESAILTIIGGIIGIIAGIAGGFAICSVMSSGQGTTITPGISLGTILFATLFSCAVGIFFGIYPAKKAAALSPIEALRRN